ncbi:MAG: hypothetical protein JXR97_11000, partial [Planctomycetes bacterium]|nr:hypothetical protein [Planctomycetota bacterium]
MNIHEALQYAAQKSTIVRERKNLLYTFGSTRLPYVCLSESPKNQGDIIVRRGEVTAEPPAIAMPGHELSFEGFDFDHGNEEEGEDVTHVMLARRIQIPPA